MSVITKDLGAATAYAYAVEKGYTGTEAEFAELMADYAEVGQRAEDAADSALESKTAAQTAATIATNKASEATQAAQTATAKAAEVQADADAAALDASQAMSAASTATSKATEATTAAATAVSSKDAAVSANTAAQSAKTAAQTAQQGAETARDAVQSSAAQITTNAEDINQLKEDLNDTLKLNALNNKVIDDVILNTADKWSSLTGYKFYIFQIQPSSNITIQTNNANAGYYCFLKSNSVVVGNSADLATDSHRTEVPANTTVTLTAPNDASYIYVAIGTDSTPRTPVSVLLDNNYELLKTIQYNINNTLAQAKDYTDTLIKNSNTFIGNSSGGYYFKYALYNGHFYLIENNSQSGTANVISRASVGGSNIQILAAQLAYGTHKIVKCTADASYLYVYTTAASELFVNDLGSVDDAVKLSQSGIVIAADGSGDFSTLRDGIDFATQIPNCMVYVKDGTYNLTTEFATEISASSTTQYGIALKNGVHIVFSSGAEVTAIYEGNDEHVTTYFAPFYADEAGGGFTLENLTIIAKNTRYCVHDEFNGADVKATNKYINCRMTFDNTTAPTINYPQCIGGGFAKNTYVEIDGCYFKSKRAETQKTPLVSYHNTNRSADALSYVSLKNCYFDDTYGIFRISYHGTSTKVSTAYLFGNSFGGAPEVIATGGSSTEVNVSIVDWNNTVRT